MAKQKQTSQKGFFDYETLTVQFGGEYSKPENIFTATAIKVPDFKIKRMEREDAGGGCYYQGKIEVEFTIERAFIILHDNQIIGWMNNPYHQKHRIKTDLLPIDDKHTFHRVKQFAEQLTATRKA